MFRLINYFYPKQYNLNKYVYKYYLIDENKKILKKRYNKLHILQIINYFILNQFIINYYFTDCIYLEYINHKWFQIIFERDLSHMDNIYCIFRLQTINYNTFIFYKRISINYYNGYWINELHIYFNNPDDWFNEFQHMTNIFLINNNIQYKQIINMINHIDNIKNFNKLIEIYNNPIKRSLRYW